MGSPNQTPVHYDISPPKSEGGSPHKDKSVAFQLNDGIATPNSDDVDPSKSQHQEFMRKQAAAITAKDFGDSTPKPGTPVQRGEIVGADGKPISYMAPQSALANAATSPSSDGDWSKVEANGNGHASLQDRTRQ